MTKKTFIEEPYFDDFDVTKGFHKILFKPRGAVQTRELNQLQTIITEQIEKFGNHIFKHGSVVSDSIPTYKQFVDYARLKDFDATPAADPVDVTKLAGMRVHGRTSEVFARVIHQAEKTDLDPATVYLQYETSGGEGGENKKFMDGEILDVLDANNNVVYSVYVRCPTCPEFSATETTDPIGYGSLFTVSAGIYYVYGYFVYIPDQIIIVTKYTTDGSFDVGFDIIQSVVTANDDLSLLDNALGYPNYSAPGADRYKIELVLAKRPLESEASDDWITLAKIKYGVLNEIHDKAQYSEIMDMLARRTYDESGNYVVKPFKVSFKEFMKSSKNANDGFVYPDENTSPQTIEKWKSKFTAILTPGKAYVKGYEVERIADSIINMDKARDTKLINSSALRIDQTDYVVGILGEDLSGNVISNIFPQMDTGESTNNAVDFEVVDLYDGPISNGTPTGVKIGRARIKSQEIFTIPLATPQANTAYKFYIFDIVLDDGKSFKDVKGISKNGTTPFDANLLTDDEIYGTGITEVKVYEPGANNLIYELPYKYCKSVTETTVTVRKKFVGAADSNGVFTFGVGGNEQLPSFNSARWLCGQQLTTGGVYVPFALDDTNTTVGVQNASISNLTPNKNVAVICDVIVNNVVEKQKKFAVQLATTTLQVPHQDEWFDIGVTDAWELLGVRDITDPANPVDITSWFELDKNIQDNYYGVSRLRKKSDAPAITADMPIEFEVRYFEHIGAQSGYFFSPKSYDAAISDPNVDFDYEDIPSYTAKNSHTYQLRSCLDFRPDMTNPSILGNQFTEDIFIPSRDTNTVFDLEYYLPRIDKIVVTDSGTIEVVKGVPAPEPKSPTVPENMMAIYEIHLEPYTFDIKKDVKAKFIDNRRYTMRDIGKLEKRIDNLEYYVTFNMLESDVANMSIKDATGAERFKNGFITDNFTNFVSSATTHPEFNAAIDVAGAQLTPQYDVRNVKLVLDVDKSQNIRIHGDVVTQEYTTGQYLSQPFSSKTISVNPYFVFNWVGEIALDPSMDSWKDTTQAPDLVTDVDSGFDPLTEIKESDQMGSLRGSWREVTRADGTENENEYIDSNGIIHTEQRETITTSLGTRVADVNLIAFMRSTEIQFIASNMRPNTRVYAFFDGVDVNAYVRPINGTAGDPLITSSEGTLIGVFNVPNNNDVQFHVGDRIFRLTDSKDNSLDEDEVTTSAEAKFWSGGISVQTQDVQLNTENVTVTESVEGCLFQDKLYNEGDVLWRAGAEPTSGTYYFSSRLPVATNWRKARCRSNRWVGFDPVPPPPTPITTFTWSGDPLAQSFTVEEENGVFLTEVGVYFSAKTSTNEPVWLEIREMINGYPGPAVEKYSHVVVSPENVSVSEDASVETKFVFEAPVYLKGQTDYCFVIGSNTPDYRVHISKLGEKDVLTNALIASQPTLGSMFKSQNNTTWNASQYEDIKFNMYKANFNRSDMKLVMMNDDWDMLNLQDDPFETESGSNFVRVHHKSHGFIPNDRVRFHLFLDTEFILNSQSGNIVVGQTIKRNSGGFEAKIKTARKLGTTDIGGTTYTQHAVTFEGIKGKFEEGDEFYTNLYHEEITNENLRNRMGISSVFVAELNGQVAAAIGKFGSSIPLQLNGIAVERFTEIEHRIVNVDSMDSYTIELTGDNNTATLTGFCGGGGVYAQSNIQTDSFELAVNIKNHDSKFEWTADTIKHSGIGSKFVGLDYTANDSISFIENRMIELEQPIKIATKTNENDYVTADASFITTGIGKAINGDSNVSPVFLLSSMGVVAITNRCDWNDCQTYSVAPNQTTDGVGVLTCDPDDPAYNARYVFETDPKGGVEKSKYILHRVSLKNPATSMRIYMDVYKNLDSAVDVYVKTLPVEESGGLEVVPWMKVDFDKDFTSADDNDFIEAQITLGDESIGQTPLPDFKEFRVKIVLRTKNSAKPPRVKNFRAIAVT